MHRLHFQPLLLALEGSLERCVHPWAGTRAVAMATSRGGGMELMPSFSSALPPPSQKSPPLELEITSLHPLGVPFLPFPSCTSALVQKGKYVSERWEDDGKGKTGLCSGLRTGLRAFPSSCELLN